MPIGYKLADGKIQLDEPKADVVKRIFADYCPISTRPRKRADRIGFRDQHKAPGTRLPSKKYWKGKYLG
jgi:hypothetical protein